MGGLGYVLGGALQGLGNGLTQQGMSEAQARRDAALETLRAQNRHSEQQFGADLDDRNNARSTVRGTSKELIVGKAQAQNQITVDNARTTNDVRLKAVDLQNQTQLARLNSALDTQRDAASQNLRQQLQGGEITQTFEADDGQIWGMTKGGDRVATGVFFAPKSQKDGADDDLLGPRGGVAAAPKAAPKTKPEAQASSSAPAPKTYSAAEVKAAAKELGWSEDQVRSWAKSNGYKLTTK